MQSKIIFLLVLILIGSASAFTGYWSTENNITLTASSPEIIRGGHASWSQTITLSDPGLNTTAREVINRYNHIQIVKAASGKKIICNGTAYDQISTVTQYGWVRLVPLDTTNHLAVVLRGTWTGA
ncbi:hypothetical protein M0R72_06940 [Candidatus Pacearchaeota archaeon]|jgi:hypothetical protein|nr:hypothetical protein [Candidatus Pacearchaeota archaeon]